MSFGGFLKSRSVTIVIAVCAIACACVIAVVCGCPRDAVILIAVVLVVSTAAALVWEYARAKRFFDELQALSTQLEHPYQLHSLISAPDAPDQAIVHEALRAMGTASASEVAQANARADEHREYIEGWVHGMKTPIASCSLVVERVPEPERAQLRREIERMKRQVETVLWHARSESARTDYAIRRIALVDIPKAACRENARFLIEHGCIPEFDIADDMHVLADIKQATFVVSQAVENSAKYGASTIRFSAERITAPTGADTIVMRIEDDGIGIPAQDVGRVFERGFTGTRGREDGSSTGMGLYLAARLCEQMDLGLQVSSAEGVGTTVSMMFPPG